ncbi:MAG: hypothetical protein LBI41_05845 [Lactobacillales bacterium]|jgi:hypothetical protein|nr:hypothetical protein [Lactobacillales bacterium]
MQVYTYQCLCLYKNQKKNPAMVIAILIFSMIMYYTNQNSFFVEYLFCLFPLLYSQLFSPIYEEDFKNGMIELLILKKYKRGIFLWQKNSFFFLISIILNLIMTIFFMISNSHLSTNAYLKLIIITVIETMCLSLINFFLQFIIDSKTALQWILSIIGLGLGFILFKYASPIQHFGKSLFIVSFIAVLMVVVDTLYIEKNYRLNSI